MSHTPSAQPDDAAPNSDRIDMPDGIPDPMTADRDAGEEPKESTDTDSSKVGAALETDQHGDPDQVT